MLKGVSALDPGTKTQQNLELDPELGGLKVANFIWDVDSLSWVRDTGGGPTPGATVFYDSRTEFIGSDLIYQGFNPIFNALTSASDWRIYKYTWDASGNPTRKQGPLTGSWDNRASLSW